MKKDLSKQPKPWDLYDFTYRKLMNAIQEELNKDISDEEMGWPDIELKDELIKNIKVFND